MYAVLWATLLMFSAGFQLELFARSLQPDSDAMKAPDLTGGVGWLNTSHPVTLKELRGKFVLLDFWTFCCINCMHIIPDLKRLEAKFPYDLVVIGVHSAKFANEKQTGNIREAILRYGIEHPVVNDADFKIWEAYAVHSWPTLVLIDPDGKIVETLQGEGHYQDVASAIERLKPQFADHLNKQPLLFDLEKFKSAPTPLSFPGKIVADAGSGQGSGHLFISDSGHNRIVITTSDGKLVDVVGNGREGLQDGAYTLVQFRHPQGLCVSGNQLYVADTENHALRLVDLSRKTVTTLAGDGVQASFRSIGGVGKSTRLSSPWDLVLVGDKLYIAMAGTHQIWCMDLRSSRIAPYAGNGRENIVDGPLSEASLAQPSGITTDGKNLYFVDSEVSAVREADLAADGKVHTLVGEGLFDFGDKDGIGKAARLQHPLGITWHKGKLYVADSYNHKIKTIDPVTGNCQSLLGTGTAGLSSTTFSEPGGLTFLGDTLFVADTNDNAIKKGSVTSKETSEFPISGLQAPSLPGSLPGSAGVPPASKIPGSSTAPILAGSAGGSTASDSKSFANLPAMPNPFKVALATQTIRPGTGKLLFDVALPHGYHLNKDTAIDYFFQEESGSSLKLGSDSKQQVVAKGTVRPPHLPISIPFTAVEGQSKLRAIATLYYCTEGQESLCSIRTLDVTAPVAVSSTAKESNLHIQCSLPAQN